MLKFDKNQVIALCSKLPKSAEIMLVGDQGVYLMSFQEVLPQGTKSRTCVYAKGMNPETDPDFYEAKRDAFGGDDGGDPIGTAESILELVIMCQRELHIKLTPTHIRTQTDCKIPVAQPKIDPMMLPPGLRKYVS